MKRNVILFVLAFLWFGSCTRREPQMVSARLPGSMEVEVERNDGVGADRIETIRFIVFTDLASRPRAEINKFYDEDHLNNSLADAAASKVRITLNVSRNVNGPNDKLVVAIANEPASMTASLNAVANPEELANLELELSHFVTADHLALKPDVAMPMSGAIWTDRVCETQAQAQANRQRMALRRAVAKVEVYLKTNIPGGLELRPGSYIKLHNTFTRSYLVYHRDHNGHELGNIRTVALPDKFVTKVREIPQEDPSDGSVGSAPPVPESADPVLVCSFYTPERRSITDRLLIEIGVKIAGDEGFKSGTLALDTVNDKEGTAHPVDIVRRNSIYQVIATVRADEITIGIPGWESEEVEVEL